MGKNEIREKLSSKVIQGTFEDAGWEYIDGAYALVAKSVSLDIENPEASVQEAIAELLQIHSLVGDHIEEIVDKYTE